MQKRKLLVLCSIGCLTCNGAAIADDSAIQGMERDSHKKTSIASLSTWCILPEGLGRVEGPRDIPDCAIRPMPPAKYPCKKEIWVRNGNRCVAIVRVELDDRVVLNPRGKGFDYGPIPDLRDMTKAQADKLWLAQYQQKETGDKVTYQLSSYGNDSTVFLDFVFADEKIKEYRVRSQDIESPCWQTIQ